MKKKVTAVCATVALAAVAMGGATLAYFTDSDKVENNFTIGDVSIDLWEYTEDGENRQPNQEGFEYENLMPSDTLIKEPVIKNTSETNDAYVRVAVTVNNAKARNAALDVFYEAEAKESGLTDKADIQTYVQEKYDEVFAGWGINNTKLADGIEGYGNDIRNAMAQRASDVEGVEIIAIDSVRCPYVGAGYQWNTWNMFQKDAEKNNGSCNCPMTADTYYKNALAEDSNVYVFYLKMAPGKEYSLFSGINVPAEFGKDQMAMFDGLKIGIYADAIQTAGFDTPEAAFNALEAEHALGWWK